MDKTVYCTMDSVQQSSPLLLQPPIIKVNYMNYVPCEHLVEHIFPYLLTFFLYIYFHFVSFKLTLKLVCQVSQNFFDYLNFMLMQKS